MQTYEQKKICETKRSKQASTTREETEATSCSSSNVHTRLSESVPNNRVYSLLRRNAQSLKLISLFVTLAHRKLLLLFLMTIAADLHY